MSACGLCDGDLSTAPVIATKARFGMSSRRVACRRCSLIQVCPQPPESELMEYYSSNQYRIDHGKVTINWGGRNIAPDSPEWPDAERAMGASRYAWTQELTGMTGGLVLDVGCGNGYVLKHFWDQGWECQGIEPDLSAAMEGDALGLRVFIGGLDSWFSDRRGGMHPPLNDLVVAYHVLEHATDPVLMLQQMRSLIHDDGMVCIEVPSLFPTRRQLISYHFQWVHMFDFTEHTLPPMLRKAGLEVHNMRHEQGVLKVAATKCQPVVDIRTPHGGEYVQGWVDRHVGILG